MVHMVKNLPTVQKTWAQSLGWEDPLGEGNGNPLQYSCLENPMNRGVCWATVHGVAELDTTEWLTHCPRHGCESWTIKNAEHRRTDTFELCWKRLLRVPWTARSNQSNPKRNQSWLFIGRTDAEAETPILRPTDVKSWLIGKVPDAGKDWRQEKKGTTEDGMVGWHHWLNGPEFEQTSGDGDGQGSLACCRPWGCKEFDMT